TTTTTNITTTTSNGLQYSSLNHTTSSIDASVKGHVEKPKFVDQFIDDVKSTFS
ncbi:hypothetical protein CYY_008763, partial [Polysphondylium violaceum]